jgi:hypothetical protein
VFFAGAGMDGETRYELHGLTTDVGNLTRSQLHDALKECGVPEDVIGLNNQRIDNLSKETVTGGERPAVFLQVRGAGARP